MHRFFEYVLLFLGVTLLQVLFFNNLQLTVYLTPLVYITFIVLLPMGISSGMLLLLGLLTGMVNDFFMGTGGINTIVTLLTAFLRPAILNLIAGKENTREGGIPCKRTLGTKKYIRYTSLLVLLQCAVFFPLEILSFRHFPATLFRIAASGIVTLLFVWLIAGVFVRITRNND